MTITRFYQALTPIHVGASSGNSQIDMPIQRNHRDGMPKIDSTTIKGAYRHKTLGSIGDTQKRLYGGDRQPGVLAFSDLNMVAFPVECSEKIHAFITSRPILEQIYQDMHLIDKDTHTELMDDLKMLITESESRDSIDKALVFSTYPDRMYLADYPFECVLLKDLTFKSAFFKYIQERLVILAHNNLEVFTNFFTEQKTRIRVSESTGTAKDSGLFSVELLPEGTIFYGHIHGFSQEVFYKNSSKKDNKNEISEQILWKKWHQQTSKNFQMFVGGWTTLGKGRLKVIEEVNHEY